MANIDQNPGGDEYNNAWAHIGANIRRSLLPKVMLGYPGYKGQYRMLEGCRVAGSQPTIPVHEESGKVKRLRCVGKCQLHQLGSIVARDTTGARVVPAGKS